MGMGFGEFGGEHMLLWLKLVQRWLGFAPGIGYWVYGVLGWLGGMFAGGFMDAVFDSARWGHFPVGRGVWRRGWACGCLWVWHRVMGWGALFPWFGECIGAGLGLACLAWGAGCGVSWGSSIAFWILLCSVDIGLWLFGMSLFCMPYLTSLAHFMCCSFFFINVDTLLNQIMSQPLLSKYWYLFACGC